MKASFRVSACIFMSAWCVEVSTADYVPGQKHSESEPISYQQRVLDFKKQQRDELMLRYPPLVRSVTNMSIAGSLMPVIIGHPSVGHSGYARDEELLREVRKSGSRFDYVATIVGKGTLLTAVTSSAGFFQFAVYVVKSDHAERRVLPVTGVFGREEVGLLAPGLNLISTVEAAIEGKVLRGKVRKSDESGPFEICSFIGIARIKPVALPENEETAAKRGSVRVGDRMTLARRRLADVQEGALAHPPEGSWWSSFWVYGDGLLAIEVDPETQLIRKLAYVLGPADESPVFLPLNRIHLTDGEMFMPIPPPPAGNSPTDEVGKPAPRGVSLPAAHDSK